MLIIPAYCMGVVMEKTVKRQLRPGRAPIQPDGAGCEVQVARSRGGSDSASGSRADPGFFVFFGSWGARKSTAKRRPVVFGGVP